jgi:hypothetical protein
VRYTLMQRSGEDDEALVRVSLASSERTAYDQAKMIARTTGQAVIVYIGSRLVARVTVSGQWVDLTEARER